MKMELQTAFDRIRADLKLLMECFHEALEEMGQPDLARLLPWLMPDPQPAAALDDLPERSAQVIAIAFQMLNMVEENRANQAMRLRESERGPFHEKGLWGNYLQQLKDAGYTQEEILEAVRRATIEPVLTAHPTEAKRWSVLQQHRQIYLLLVSLENSMYTPFERDELRRAMKVALERLWRTGEILLAKPDVASERRNVLYYLREVFPTLLRETDRRFLHIWNTIGFEENLPITRNAMPGLRVGSWVGGDRDGHPLVTEETTRRTLADLRQAARQMIIDQLAEAERNLVLSINAQQAPDSLIRRLKELCAQLGATRESFGRRGVEEPWSCFAQVLGLALRSSANGENSPAGLYPRPQALLDDLRLLSDSLYKVGSGRLARVDVFPIIRSVEVFGFHLARLDIRQNSGVHDDAVAELLEAAGFEDCDFPNWPEEKRVEFLNHELSRARPFTAPNAVLGENAQNVLSCYRVLVEHMKNNGRAGLGALIISMTRSLSDLLAVYLLAREVGLAFKTPDGLVCPLPVVPLFETLEDLHNAEGILRSFLEHPLTRRSLPLQSQAYEYLTINELLERDSYPLPEGDKPAQQVMLGYSDSNKDAGILASQWALHCTQKKLLAVGDDLGVGIFFFHGRGGTVSRGSGPTDRFLEALPKGALATGMRMTEQGESISQKYANHLTGSVNVELLTAGAVGVHLQAKRGNGIAPRTNEVTEHLATLSRKAYRGLLDQENFMTFYSQATPIDVLENSRIGSRPARRTGQRTLNDLRAIPWVFSWNQSRFYLPGWFGMGSALQALRDESPDDFQYFCRHSLETPFLRYVLYNVESSLAAADLEIARSYANLVAEEDVREEFFEIITREHALAVEMFTDIFQGPLAERRPRFVMTLRLRDTSLQMLHHQQVNLLRKWRAAQKNGDDVETDTLLPHLLLSVNAIASGLRTTG